MKIIENAYLTFQVVPTEHIDTSKVIYMDIAYDIGMKPDDSGWIDMTTLDLIYDDATSTDDSSTFILKGFRNGLEAWEIDLVESYAHDAHLIIQDASGNEIEVAAHAQMIELIDLQH